MALLHGDGQYAPEILGELVDAAIKNNSMALFGSRMISKYGALKNGMPLYKFFGNKILTFLQNKILNAKLSEFHSGYRIYKVSALKEIPFHLNSNDYTFDTEIIIQFLFSKFKISEVSIPTFMVKKYLMSMVLLCIQDYYRKYKSKIAKIWNFL